MTSFLQQLSNTKQLAALLLAFGQTHPGYMSSPCNESEETLREKMWQRRRYARKLSAQLNKQTLHFGTAQRIAIKVAPDKIRFIHKFSIQDQLIMKLMAKITMPHLIQVISPHVYSYIPGRSHIQAIQQVCRYLRKNRDVYLIRTDITQYTDSILTHDEAPLWKILENFLHPIESEVKKFSYLMQLFKEALRPIIQTSENSYQQCQGISLGTSLTPIVANLYLAAVDHAIITTGIGLYVRFGDDIIMADTQKERLLTGNQLLNQEVKRLHLIRQPQKDQYYLINRAGRTESTTHPFKGSVNFEYLGLKISAQGTIALPVNKQRKLLSDIFHRIDRLHAQLKNFPLNVQTEVLCHSLSQSFVNSPLAVHYQEMLLQLVNDTVQLKQIDYLIARYIAEKLSGQKGVRAFRTIAYRQLRALGLDSLCYLRHHSPARAAYYV